MSSPVSRCVCAALAGTALLACLPEQNPAKPPAVLEAERFRLVKDGKVLWELASIDDGGVQWSLGMPDGARYTIRATKDSLKVEGVCGGGKAVLFVRDEACLTEASVNGGKCRLQESVGREVAGRDSWVSKEVLSVGDSLLAEVASDGLARFETAHADNNVRFGARSKGVDVSVVAEELNPLISAGKGFNLFTVSGAVTEGFDIELIRAGEISSWTNKK